MILEKCKFLLICTITIFITNNAHASAWTREKNESIFILETLRTANKFRNLYSTPNKSTKYFIKRETKLYGEHGLSKNLTAGGNLKLYSIKIKNNNMLQKISSDKTMELFLMNKLWSQNNDEKIISFRTAYFKPIEFTKGLSERLNYAETREALDLRLLFGLSKNGFSKPPFFINNGYFINIEIGTRLLKNSFYNEAIFEPAIGLKANANSVILLQYKLNYDYYKGTFFKKVGRKKSIKYGKVLNELRQQNNHYLSDTHHEINISSLTRFRENFLFEIKLLNSFGRTSDSKGVGMAFWFLF